ARLVRLEHGRPRYGDEITERYLLQETGQLHAVSFHKGCYLGQEIVERVRSRALLHRHLHAIEVSCPPPAAGTTVQSRHPAAGEPASAAYSERLAKTVGMAYIKAAFAEPGTPLVIDGHPAVVK